MIHFGFQPPDRCWRIPIPGSTSSSSQREASKAVGPALTHGEPGATQLWACGAGVDGQVGGNDTTWDGERTKRNELEWRLRCPGREGIQTEVRRTTATQRLDTTDHFPGLGARPPAPTRLAPVSHDAKTGHKLNDARRLRLCWWLRGGSLLTSASGYRTVFRVDFHESWRCGNKLILSITSKHLRSIDG